MKRWEKIFHESKNQKKARVAIIISEKIDNTEAGIRVQALESRKTGYL